MTGVTDETAAVGTVADGPACGHQAPGDITSGDFGPGLMADDAEPGSRRTLANALLLAAGALLYLSFGYTEMAGSDMWWHLAAGRELVQTGSLWMVDHWSFPGPPRPWLNHEWLSDLIYYGWASLWGVTSLVYWKWLVIVATFVLLQQVLARASGSQLAALLCALVAAAVAAPFLDVRPHLYTLLLYSILLLLTLRRRPRRALLALLFVVWVNLHGGYFFGFMALAILVFPWRELSPAALKTALLMVALCVLAASLNPSGVKAFLFPLKYAFDHDSPFRQIGEWLPPFTPGGIRSPLFFVVMWLPAMAGLYLLPQVRRHTGIPVEGLLLSALTLAMALTSRRFIPLFGMSLAVLLAPLVAWCFQLLQLHRAQCVLAAVALLAGIYRMLPWPLQAAPAFHYLTAEYTYPVDTLNYMQANGIRGRVYALYNWGGYLHWRSDDDLQVFIDGRADTIYDEYTYNHYLNVLLSRPGWLEQVEATGAQFMLWPNMQKDGQAKLQALLASGRWQPVYQDAVSWLLARNTITLPTQLQDSPPTPWRAMARAQQSSWSGHPQQAIEYAEQARRDMPWHQGACNLLTSSYRITDQPDKAEQVLRECRGYFPSYLLH